MFFIVTAFPCPQYTLALLYVVDGWRKAVFRDTYNSVVKSLVTQDTADLHRIDKLQMYTECQVTNTNTLTEKNFAQKLKVTYLQFCAVFTKTSVLDTSPECQHCSLL